MSVKIRDILELDLFKHARVACGENGLDNEIKRVNFSDSPLFSNPSNRDLVMEKDFFINSLYVVRDNEDDILKTFQTLVNYGFSGICITDEYIKDLPKKVVQYSNENSFPVIFINASISYAKIIKTIMEIIILDQTNTIFEMRIDRLNNNNISKEEVITLSKFINNSFEKYYASLYIYLNNSNLPYNKINFFLKDLIKNFNLKAYKYKYGILVIINLNNIELFEKQTQLIKEITSNYCTNYNIVISDIFSKPEDFHYCIKQSISLSQILQIINEDVVYYKDLDLYKILYPMRNSIYLYDYYNHLLNPIKDYDRENNSDLFEILRVFFDNYGDYNKTTLVIKQHEKTIRKKILKIRRILKLEDNYFKFIEQVSVAMKIEKIINLIKQSD